MEKIRLLFTTQKMHQVIEAMLHKDLSTSDLFSAYLYYIFEYQVVLPTKMEYV